MIKQVIVPPSTTETKVNIVVSDYVPTIDVTQVPGTPLPPNQAPVVDAGTSQTIQLPTSSATLKGSASDADGMIVSSVWSKIQGPAATIVSPTALQTQVTGLSAGNYIFRLTVTDDDGAIVSKDTTILVNAASTTTPVTFTPVQLTNDFVRPGAGAEQWHGAWDVDIFPGTTGPDKYYRFQWYQFEKGKRVYDFTDFDNQIHEAIDRGGKFGFGIMTCFNGVDAGRRVDYPDGTYSSYPAYLHSEMQASNTKDVKNGQCWVPNINSEAYLSGWEELNKVVYAHLDTTYKGIKLKDAIKYYDIRGFGNYGEWHTSGIENSPAGTFTSYKRIIDAVITSFPDLPLLSLIAALDGGSTGWAVFPAPKEISHYLLTAKNAWGEIGWRRDSLGSTEAYLSEILEGNDIVVNGQRLGDLIMNKWKVAPIHGEPNSGVHMDPLPGQVTRYHMCSFGNGNYNVSLTSTDNSKVKQSSKLAGFWLTITSGNITGNQITINWQNNQCPVYDNYEVFFEIRNGSSITTLKSLFNPRLFMGSKSHTDTFASVPAGSLYVVLKDKYRKPLPLAVAGRESDGAYKLT